MLEHVAARRDRGGAVPPRAENTLGRRGYAAAPGRLGGGRQPRLQAAVLDAWASSDDVVGHAFSESAGFEFGTPSTSTQHGLGWGQPSDWVVGTASRTGKKGRGAKNQDSFSYTVLQSGWMLGVVLDGHGESGDVISRRVARTLPYFVARHMHELEPQEALHEGFLAAQADLEQICRAEQIYSGTTVVAWCIHPERRKAWCANVGDSQAVLADMSTGAVVFVSEEHKAHDEKEHARLTAANAEVVVRRYPDGDVMSRVFEPRTGIPGLAMSRALGDGCLKKHGVIAEPTCVDVSELWAQCADPAFFSASDGLFNIITPEQAISKLAKRVRGGLDVIRGLDVLAKRTQRIWIEVERDYCDDVTLFLAAPASSLGTQSP